MKRINILMLILCLFIVGCGNKNDYYNWTKIKIFDSDTLKIPNKWKFEVSENYYLLMDKESGDIKFIGYKTSDFNTKEYIQFRVDKYDVSIHNRDDSEFGVVYGGLSTGVIYGKIPVFLNGNEEYQYYIYMGAGEDTVEWITVDMKQFDDEFIEKMARGINEP